MIQAVKDLQRLREISAVVVRHGFGELLDRSRLWDVLGRREPGERPSPAEMRATSARRFRETLADLGPTFIKLGLIEQGLGRPAAELFAHIEPEPLASASIAQVHRARLLDGESVVVKVQRPAIEQQIRSDTDLLSYLARIIEDFAKTHAGRELVVIPRVLRTHSSRTVLTLEELVGVKLKTVLEDPAAEGVDRKALARNILDASFHQLFADGLFHGDPHPGNVIVLPGNRLGLIDFGLVGRLSKGMQESIILLVLAISLRDPDTVARLLYKVGVPDERINLHQFRADIHDILDRYLGLKLSEVSSTTLLNELTDLALKYRIKIPKEYAVLSKASATTEGIIRQLDPDLDVAQVALPYAKQLLVD